MLAPAATSSALAVVTQRHLGAPPRRTSRSAATGFLLGDGTLHYGREDIVEAYYTLRASHGVSPAIDVQVIDHPGYNVDRGPIVVGSLRLHVEL